MNPMLRTEVEMDYERAENGFWTVETDYE